MPYVLYQCGASSRPALPPREALRIAAVRLERGALLRWRGVRLYFIRLPLMFAFLTTTNPGRPDDEGHVELLGTSPLLLFFAFGIGVRGAIAVVLLASTGLVKWRPMKKNRGYVLFASSCGGVPDAADAISQSSCGADVHPLRVRHPVRAVLTAEPRPPRPRPRKRRGPVSKSERRLLRPPTRARHALFTEMWERSRSMACARCCAGSSSTRWRAAGYGFDDKTATAIYGLYTAAVFMAGAAGRLGSRTG